MVAFASLASTLLVGRAPPRGWRRAALSFAVIVVVASLAARSTGRSLYGPYEGHLGGLAWLAYLALAAAQSSTRITTWMRALVGVSVLQAAIAIAQHLMGLAPRGTMGHPMFLAALLMLGSLAALGLAVDSPPRRRAATVVLAFMPLVGSIVLTGRRAPLVGVALGLGVILVLTRRKWVLAAGAGGVAAVLLLWTTPIPDEDRTAGSRYAALVGREASPLHLDTIRQRLDYYRVAANGIPDAPLLGRGFGSFRDLYQRERDPTLGRYESSPHSVWLDVGLSCGLLGLAAFVLLVGRSASEVRKALSDAPTEERGVVAAAAAILAAYLVQCSFNLDQPGVGVWAWGTLGVLLTRRHELGRPLMRTALVPAGLAALALLPLVADAHARAGLEQSEAWSKARIESIRADWTNLTRLRDLEPFDLFYTFYADRPDGAAVARPAPLEEVRSLRLDSQRFLLRQLSLRAAAAPARGPEQFHLLMVISLLAEHLGPPAVTDELAWSLRSLVALNATTYAAWSRVREREGDDLHLYVVGKTPWNRVEVPGGATLPAEVLEGRIAAAMGVPPAEASGILERSARRWSSLHLGDLPGHVARLKPTPAAPRPSADNGLFDAYRRALRLTPFECLYAVKLADALARGYPGASAEERIQLLGTCVDHEAQQPFLHHQLGRAHCELTPTPVHQARCLASLAHAVELAPYHAQFRLALAEALFDQGQTQAALQEVAAGLRLQPRHAALLWLNANILGTLPDRTTEAQAAYQAALAAIRAPFPAAEPASGGVSAP